MRVLAILPIAGVLGGCGKVPPACDQIDLPMEPLAVGAIGDFEMRQSSSDGVECDSTEYLLAEETFEDPTLFAIEPADYDGHGRGTRIRLRALASGTTTLTATGHFNLFSEEEIRVELRSAAADRAELEPISDHDLLCEPPVRVQVGHQLRALVHLSAGDEPLSGNFLVPFEAPGLVPWSFVPTTEMLARMPPLTTLEPTVWTVPDAPAAGGITSKLANASWSLAWEAFDATRVDGLSLMVDADAGTRAAVSYRLYPTIGGSVPCTYDPTLVFLTTTTTQICTVDTGVVWRVAAGTCQLEGRMTGGTVTTTRMVTFH